MEMNELGSDWVSQLAHFLDYKLLAFWTLTVKWILQVAYSLHQGSL